MVVSGDSWSIEAVATPGHTANHMAFAFKEKNILLSGEHVMGWSTSIVAPPDGSMRDYLASLNKLVKRSEIIYFPPDMAPPSKSLQFRQPLHSASQIARRSNLASAGDGRRRHSDHCKRQLCRD